MGRPRRTMGEAFFSYLNYTLLAVLGFVMLLPLLSVLSVSLSSSLAVDTGKVFIIPVDFTFASWGYIFTLKRIWKSLFLTASATLAGTSLSLLLNALMAYPLSKKEFAPGQVHPDGHCNHHDIQGSHHSLLFDDEEHRAV